MIPFLLLAVLLVHGVAADDVALVGESQTDDTGRKGAVVERVAPQFPTLLLMARISATVSVRVRVSPAGHVVGADGTVTSSVAPPLSPGLAAMFEDAAEAAALKWRFTAEPDGSARQATVTFIFTAKQNDSPVENNEQKAQRDVVVREPLTLELIEARSVCYTPGERVR